MDFIHFFLVVSSIELNLGGLWFDDLIHSFYFHGLVQFGYFFIYGGFHFMVHEWFHLGENVVDFLFWYGLSMTTQLQDGLCLLHFG
jgi:hypothetical protein